MSVWQKQPDFPDSTWHLGFDAGFYVVAKSAGGDWYAGWNPETEPCITDDTFEYFDTWQQARAYCETLTKHTKIQDGSRLPCGSGLAIETS